MLLLNEQISKEDLKSYLKEFYIYAISKLKKIDRAPKLFLNYDQKNADNMFGKTGYYNPDDEEIHLFVTDRHPKDILRSFAHELVHHEQNCRGSNKNLDLSKTANDPAYASNDLDLREMEREAFEIGNMIFRDWCDMKKINLKDKIMAENKNNQSQDNTPYPELFKEKERLLKDRMNSHEETLFQELMKKFINEKK